MQVFASNADKDHGRTEFVLGLLDLSLDEKTLADMMKRAVDAKNPTAFEYAAERSLDVGKILSELSTSPQSIFTQQTGGWLAYSALRAGSLKCFDELMKVGVNLQGMINRSIYTLPLLSDLDPDRLGDRLRSLRYEIDEVLIDSARSEAGRKALIALQQANPKH
ncbi:MAG: hypothetical protein EBZ75_15625 [Oxalobacteraceae bacterium]|nr:hypothetical protein [Oxalobacteraceae bacterium]